MTVHTLRHSFATHLHESGADLTSEERVRSNLPIQKVKRPSFFSDPLDTGGVWQAHGVIDKCHPDTFRLTQRSEDVLAVGERRRGHAVALVELPVDFDGDLYVICGHFESRSGQDRLRLRNLQADAVVNCIADARTPRGAVSLPSHTGFLVLGDLNVVDSPAPYVEQLLAAGPRDLLPRHNGQGDDIYTWRVDFGEYPPNALDRMLLGGESLFVANSFVLNTTVMTFQELQLWNLRSIDVMRDPLTGMHDHLPVVADVTPRRR